MTGFRPRTASEWLLVLWNRKLTFLLVAIVVFSAASIIVSGLPNVYESRALIAVTPLEKDRLSSAARITAVTQQLTSTPNLATVAKSENVFGPISSDAEVTRSVAVLSSGVTLDTKYRGSGPESITISYRDTDPKRAQRVVTELVGLFDRTNAELVEKSASEARDINTEMSDINARLLVLASQRSAATVRSQDVEHARSEQDLERAKREAIAATAEELSDKQVLLERQIAQQNDQIRAQQTVVAEAAKQGGARAGASYGPLLTRKAELEAKLNTYTTEFTDKHPKVLETQSELAEVNRQIGLLDSQSGESTTLDSPAASELRALQRDLGRMQAELEVTKRALDRKRALAGNAIPAATAAAPTHVAAAAPAIAAVPADDAEAEVQYQTLQDRYRALMAKQIALADGGSGQSLFQLTDPPTFPRGPVGPNRLKYELLALAVALGAALLVVASLEIRRLPVVYDARDVEYFLGVPVIALIPETTHGEIPRPNRLIGAVRTAGVVLLAVVSVPALVVLFQMVKALAGR